MTLHIGTQLAQLYSLRAEPGWLEGSIEVLRRLEERWRAEQPGSVGQWALFVWLDRVAVWAIRPIQATSGLDSFLLEEGALPGVIDVAETISHVIGPSPEGTASDGLATSVEQFVDTVRAADSDRGAVLFATFLWPDWDALLDRETWGAEGVPRRSLILLGLRLAFGAAWGRAMGDETAGSRADLLLTCAMGDSDLILYGLVRATDELDTCLLTLTDLTTADVARALGLPAGTGGVVRPVFLRTRTELAFPLGLYRALLQEAGVGPDPSEQGPGVKGRGLLEGKVFPEIGLVRGRGPLSALRDRLAQVLPDGWVERAVFGTEDLVLSPRDPVGFGSLVRFMARLDVEASRDPAFPRRNSLRLGFGALRNDGTLWPAGRVASREGPHASAVAPAMASVDIEPLLRLIKTFRQAGWREDLRVIERMVERCITLRKWPGLRRQTRLMLESAIRRLAAAAARLFELERAIETLDGEETEEARMALGHLDRDTAFLRQELMYAGMQLERTLTHHFRGAVSLLLHRGVHARGTSHFASELGLASGLATLVRAPAVRIREALSRLDPAAAPAEARDDLMRQLDELADPILYASHDEDFAMLRRFVLVRVPRWAMWYPTATTGLLHELGHGLAVVGSLNHYASALAVAAGAGEMGNTVHRAADLERLRGRVMEAVGSGGWRLFRSLRAGRHDDMFLEEVFCEALRGLLAYAGCPDREAERRWLWDNLDYFTPGAARRQADHGIGFLQHLWAAHVAMRVVRCDGDPWSGNTWSREVGTFMADLDGWCGDSGWRSRVRPVHARPILNAVRGFQASRHGSDEDPLVDLGRWAGLLFRVTTAAGLEDPSLLRGSLLFGCLHGLMVGSQPAQDTVEELARRLWEGEVPATRCSHPERLPAALAWRGGDAMRGQVPPRARFALSEYLQDHDADSRIFP